MTKKKLDPFTLPAEFRGYAYSEIVLGWETGRVRVKPGNFSRKVLEKSLEIFVLRIDSLADLRAEEDKPAPTKEHLVFLRGKSGYKGIFKRLRDTFAHGDFGSPEDGWIEIRHRYKQHREKIEQTRVFGKLKVDSLKRLVSFLEVSGGK
ncbi:MAG: hypothetical protein IPI75_10200 [Gammaproteobacteria bacterium]|nr:hypothetical protein [Gammaproteobacteria bacterium]